MFSNYFIIWKFPKEYQLSENVDLLCMVQIDNSSWKLLSGRDTESFMVTLQVTFRLGQRDISGTHTVFPMITIYTFQIHLHDIFGPLWTLNNSQSWWLVIIIKKKKKSMKKGFPKHKRQLIVQDTVLTAIVSLNVIIKINDHSLYYPS